MPPPNLYARVRILLNLLHASHRVRRAPGLPCALISERTNEMQSSGRIAPREGERVSSVIASEAKQSIAQQQGRVDCFASLAMTRIGRSVLDTPHAWRERCP